jgi:hypothetical protein
MEKAAQEEADDTGAAHDLNAPTQANHDSDDGELMAELLYTRRD